MSRAKQKAIELFIDFRLRISNGREALNAAILAVDKIIESLLLIEVDDGDNTDHIDFWVDVGVELQILKPNEMPPLQNEI